MVLSLSIHTVTAWRQLRKFDRLGFRTPVLWCWKFPWGKEEYWGDRRVYLWFRGAFASTVIQSWLMALEDWAFAQIEAGANLDETIQSVISHNPCVAVLGIAVTLALESKQVSPTTIPLLSSQCIWLYDVERYAKIDRPKLYPTQMGLGLRGDSEAHVAAIDRMNARPCRNNDIRSLVIGASFLASQADRDRMRTAIEQFPADLPFEYQEETEVPRFARCTPAKCGPDVFAIQRHRGRWVQEPQGL